MAFYVTMATFWMTLLTNKFYKYCHGWCMSSSIGHKTYLLLSAICDERSSWVFEIWMKKHTVCDTNCNIVKSIMPSKNYKEWQIMLGLHLVLVTLHRGGSWLVSSKTTRIGDTTNHIFSVLRSQNCRSLGNTKFTYLVPAMCIVIIWVSSSGNNKANPKSAIKACKFLSSKMLLALISRWMILGLTSACR